MSEQLNPEGIPVFVGDVRITTPGLVGLAEVYEASSDGMRGAEDLTAEFRAALADAQATEQLTVEISDHTELTPTGGSRAGGGGDDIEVEVPAPGEGNGQVLLYAAEDGSLSWHLPEDVTAEQVPTRGAERRTYRIPRAIVVPGADDTAGSGDRGVLGAIGTKLLKVIVFPLVDPVLGRVGDYFADRWEKQHRRNQVRWMRPDAFADGSAPAFTAADWSTVAEGPALLFLHGTFAQAHTAFAGLPELTRVELDRRYEGRVFALDHFTIGPTPRENIVWLADQLGDCSLVVDIVAHSRGGLVGRALAERADELGLGDRVQVRTLVMVGTPNAGTALADREHISALLDRITDLAQFVPTAGVVDILGLVLAILKQVAVGAAGGLEGIMAMNPSGPDLTDFNDSPGSTAEYRAIAANYNPPQGSPLTRVARNGATDVVFSQAQNDLVVPTDGCYDLSGVAGFPVADPVVFEASEAVDHLSFFSSPKVSAALLAWLPGA